MLSVKRSWLKKDHFLVLAIGSSLSKVTNKREIFPVFFKFQLCPNSQPTSTAYMLFGHSNNRWMCRVKVVKIQSCQSTIGIQRQTMLLHFNCPEEGIYSQNFSFYCFSDVFP